MSSYKLQMIEDVDHMATLASNFYGKVGLIHTNLSSENLIESREGHTRILRNFFGRSSSPFSKLPLVLDSCSSLSIVYSSQIFSTFLE